jgi:hypothetical protein
MYMVRMIIVFPAKLKEDVIPVDKPTVPNADISSNKRLIKLLSGSVIDNINVEIKISEIENNAIEKALLMVSPEIVCFTISTFFRPLIVLKAERSITEKVVVLIPPPVEPGDAPMNIRNIMKIRTGWPRWVKSTELNPAVRQVTD